MRVHHIGYLVKDLTDSVQVFQDLGYKIEVGVDIASTPSSANFINVQSSEQIVSPIVTFDDIRQVNIIFMANGSYRIELVEPISKDSPVYGLLKRYANSPYHVCYCSSDLNHDIKTLQENCWTLFQAPQIAPAIIGCQVAFLMNSSIGMIELVAEK